MNPAGIDPAQWLPQSGAMVLIDAIVLCDGVQIACRAQSHRRAQHPLASAGRLPIWAGIEYAAQAIALHRALVDADGRRPRIGFLGALRDVVLAVDRLDDIPQALIVTASRLIADGTGAVYRFSLGAEGSDTALLAGRATVVQAVG